jgi:hypothetical protein
MVLRFFALKSSGLQGFRGPLKVGCVKQHVGVVDYSTASNIWLAIHIWPTYLNSTASLSCTTAA